MRCFDVFCEAEEEEKTMKQKREKERMRAYRVQEEPGKKQRRGTIVCDRAEGAETCKP
jgi:hypothetical protein